jgi:hypothetical protein
VLLLVLAAVQSLSLLLVAVQSSVTLLFVVVVYIPQALCDVLFELVAHQAILLASAI